MKNIEKARQLISVLWTHYKKLVPYAARFSDYFCDIELANAIDHIAFRTVRNNPFGMDGIEKVWRGLGYTLSGSLEFPEKRLLARYYAHPQCPRLPKVFISEFKFDTDSQIDEEVRMVSKAFGHGFSYMLNNASIDKMSVDHLANFFMVPFCREAPTQEDITSLDSVSEYVSWVRIFGNLPNHFTAAVDLLPGDPCIDIEQLSAKMSSECGIPMTGKFEGERGSKLRQTSTEAVEVDVPVFNAATSQIEMIKRKYAYFELAERGHVRFDGFLGPQATNLFGVTNK